MTQETYKKAEQLQEEISRINILTDWLKEIDSTQASCSDTEYLAKLIGKDKVMNALQARLQQLKQEFEQL